MTSGTVAKDETPHSKPAPKSTECNTEIVHYFALSLRRKRCGVVQSRIQWRGSIVNYDRWPLIVLLLGAGAIGGDMVKSFFKRRLKIAPGDRWIPADQLDFGIGALLLIAPIAGLSWIDVIVVLAITFVGDILVNQVAFRFHIRDTAR